MLRSPKTPTRKLAPCRSDCTSPGGSTTSTFCSFFCACPPPRCPNLFVVGDEAGEDAADEALDEADADEEEGNADEPALRGDRRCLVCMFLPLLLLLLLPPPPAPSAPGFGFFANMRCRNDIFNEEDSLLCSFR